MKFKFATTLNLSFGVMENRICFDDLNLKCIIVKKKIDSIEFFRLEILIFKTFFVFLARNDLYCSKKLCFSS